MSKQFFKLLVVFVFGLFFSISCKKNQHDVAVSNPDQTNFSIAQAKLWYTTNFNNKQSGFIGNKANSKIGIFSPLWALSKSDGDNNYEVVETPLSFDRTPGFSFSANAVNNINGTTSLLVLKNKRSGEILSALRHIFSKSGVIDKNITYSKIPPTFTGNIFFTDLAGGFINGWQYEDGKITRKSNKQINAANPAGKILPPGEGGCNTIETLWFERDCIEYYNGNYQCGAWHYTYSTYQTYCIPTGSGGDAGGGGYGGYDTSKDPNENPDGAANICKSSFKFRKFIETSDDGGGWQEAGTIDIHMNIVDLTTKRMIRLQLPTMYFGLPVLRVNGEFYSTTTAAKIAKDAVEWAEDQVMIRYHQLGGTLDAVGMTLLLRQKINEHMQMSGGKASLLPSAGVVITDFGTATYSWPVFGCL
jgi:hypothetical protein